MRVHLEQENTQEKEKFFQLRESFMKPLQDETWKLATTNSVPTLYTRRY